MSNWNLPYRPYLISSNSCRKGLPKFIIILMVVQDHMLESARNCIFDLRPDPEIYALNHQKASHSLILALLTMLDTVGTKDKKDLVPVCSVAHLHLYFLLYISLYIHALTIIILLYIYYIIIYIIIFYCIYIYSNHYSSFLPKILSCTISVLELILSLKLHLYSLTTSPQLIIGEF